MDNISLEELRSVLAAHAARYPLMRPRDAVKLLYQNEFGGGHLIANPKHSLRALEEEYSATAHDPSAPLAEELGGGMVRINLAALDRKTYPLKQLNRDFVRSAALRQGDTARFLEKLDVLRQLTQEGAFSFQPWELEEYLTGYIADGCPPFSHGGAYRMAYRPAYRVILRETSFPLLAEQANTLAAGGRRVLIALDGRCASGKTTLAERLRQDYGWSVIHMDHFFLRPSLRTPERYAQPGGNIDHERFLEELLLPLRQGTKPLYRPFDCQTGQLLDPFPFSPGPVVLVEGSYACHPALWEHFDLHAFLDIDLELQMKRITARNGADYAQVFRDKWIPLEERYFSTFQIKNRCEYRFEL